MKKWIGLFTFAACLFLNSAVAKADVIWTPDDNFFIEYEEDCSYFHRSFLVNGPGGEVIVYESPIDASEVARIDNGTQVWVDWIYKDTDGIVWGSYDGYFDGNDSGWVSLAYMDLIYDYISFEEDYGSEFVAKEGVAKGEDGVEEIYVWNYPGSPICETMQVTPDDMPMYSMIYEDEDGRTWGFCSYRYGWRNFWMCLDNLTADHEELYGYEPVEPTPEIDESKPNEIVSEIDESKPIVPGHDRSKEIIGFAVGGVVVVTAIVLVVVKKKMKKV